MHESCTCHPAGPQTHLQVSYLQREVGAGAYSFSSRHIQRLIDGSVYEAVFEQETRRWTYVPDPEVEQASDPHTTWAGLLSVLETTGQLESEGAMIVMDLERGLHLMSRAHPDAAAVIAARVMNDLSDEEMDEAFPPARGRPNWRRLRAKAVAWLHAYLRGLPITAIRGPSCERAYRGAR